MGQAKCRGSFEQRKKESIARKQEEDRKWNEALAAKEAAMTPEERETRRKAREKLALIAGMAADVGKIHRVTMKRR